MKVIHLNCFDIIGGAARAAYRIHHALRRVGVDSWLWVDVAASGDWTVEGPTTNFGKGLAILRRALGRGLVKSVLKTGNPILHSPAFLPSGRVRALNSSDADILHLHWVQGEMLSIEDIGRLRKPVVWTLHDMWAFCGAEHYTEDHRWREGYRHNNRPSYERGFDLNRWTWTRKRKCWKHPIHIVTPSRWLAQCVQESALMHEWPLSVIPNPIDTERWQPLETNLARELFGLPKGTPLLLFGAMGGGRDPRKGFDLLLKAIQHLRSELPELQLVIFGELCPRKPPDLGFSMNYVGHLADDLSLRILYSAADVMIVPSRLEAFGQTTSEAHACGTPVVAFNTSGLRDIVLHKETGYLAQPFDPEDLARGIQWVLSDSERHLQLRKNARARAVDCFASEIVAAKYLQVYEAALNDSSS
ncbi:glycosyltransferase [Thermosynechococcus sp. NK55a]|uniref:glycosyltransferase family 4 protein n=1 Tax=Thermosynechococcus sp. NK55a TaxID=1394889 RepID=UPI0003D8EA39|nr:glycosyltransferase family 4 protein [Thermosynechococcus sp. NK55a]AHB87951.1 glycosyltransferase [Thermosynechococcus sp. NK55a]